MQIHESLRPKVRYLQVFTGHFIGWRWIDKKQVAKEIEIAKLPSTKYVMKIFAITDANTMFDFMIEKMSFDVALYSKKRKLKKKVEDSGSSLGL